MGKLTKVSAAAMAIAFLAASAPASAQEAARAPWRTSGALIDEDSSGDDGHRYDHHAVLLEAGQRYSLTVTSDAFDPVARLYRSGQGDPVAENDDSDGSLNARINYSPAEGGEFVLRVSAFATEGRGAYVARLEVLPPLPPGVAVPWSTTGRLEDGDGAGEGSGRADDHVVRLEAGRRYRLYAESEAFDPVAELRAPGRGEVVARNDDSGGSLNSRISYGASESGDYVFTVSSFGADGRGAYRAGVELMPPLPPPVSAPGTTVSASGSWALWQGALEASDPDSGGRRFDDYLIRVEAGQRRYISLEGTGFDTLVQVLVPAERDKDSPAVLEQDDDAGAGLNSFLVFAPEQAGDYIVRVTSVGDSNGAYRLWISQ
ncbi:MAG TPA: hypothetical protein VJS15_01385 [Allosphingosinicella sp.]|nr:hypothetical protein [Allosphingosinicella sp.]